MAFFTHAQNGQGPQWAPASIDEPTAPEAILPTQASHTPTSHSIVRIRRDEEGVARFDDIRMRVRLAVGYMLPARPDQERRREHRYPFPYPIPMTPVDEKGNETGEERFTAIGRHLSEQGFDFYSKEAIPHRFLVAALPVGEDQAVGILLDLNWCRFGQHGWYENGGKFTQVVE